MDATLVAFSGPVMGASAVFADEPRSIGRDEDHCAAIAEFLIEIEMFGHQRSAFTGAIAQKRGKIEAADGGTLFLDEMCELDPPLQAKLLRVLQERQIERVGGIRPIEADIRVVAATNSDVDEDLREGRLREDLHYRGLEAVTTKSSPTPRSR